MSELSGYAQARIALAKLKILQQRLDIIRFATPPEGAESFLLAAEKSAHSIADQVAVMEEEINTSLSQDELTQMAVAANAKAEELVGWSYDLVQIVAPGF